MRLTQLIKWVLFGHLIKEADAIAKASADIARDIPQQPEGKDACLQYYKGGLRFSMGIKEGRNCVGSSYQADFVVGGTRDISAKHAVITKQGEQYFIENVSPEGKTLVNGVPLAKDEKPKPIQYGAVISLDDLRMEFLRCPKEA